MEMNLSYSQAAARQSWHRDSMRNKLTDLKDEHPKASDDELVRLFLERMREDETYLIAAGEYAVRQTLDTLDRRTKQAQVDRPAVAPEVKAKTRAAADAAVERVKAKIILLNFIMPNGKRMRFCSGKEMIEMGTTGAKECAAWIKIGKKAGTKLVGQALSEKQVQEMLG